MQASAPLILFDDVLMSNEISGRQTGSSQDARSQINSWTSGPDRALDLRWPTLRVTCLAITSSHLRKNNNPPAVVKKCILSVYWRQHKARSLKPVFDSVSLADWKCNATASLLLLPGHSTRAGPSSFVQDRMDYLMDIPYTKYWCRRVLSTSLGAIRNLAVYTGLMPWTGNPCSTPRLGMDDSPRCCHTPIRRLAASQHLPAATIDLLPFRLYAIA